MAQLLANTALSAALILLLGLGFSLIYRVARFFHVAHGAVFTLGAYGFYLLVEILDVSEFLAIPLVVVTCSLSGIALYIAVHRPLDKRQATPVVHLVASLGLYIAITNILALTFGDQTLTLLRPTITEGLDIYGARLTPIQLATIAIAISTTVLIAWIIDSTNGGLRYRAVATDKELSIASGVRVEWVIAGAFAGGSAIAGLAGLLVASDVDVRPTMGLGPLLLSVVGVIVGGQGSIRGLILGAALIATIQSITGWYLGQHWREPAVFALLVLFLVMRPQGLVASAAMAAER
jgi:branched-chain amino acid transport system permease protein